MSDINQQIQGIQREEEESHAKAFAEQNGLPYINLMGYPVEPDNLAVVPKDQAIQFGVVSYDRKGNVISVATNHPEREDLKSFLTQLEGMTKCTILVNFCSHSSILYGLHLYQVLLPEVTTTAVEVSDEAQESFEQEVENIQALREKITQVSTTELLDVVFAGAVKLNASDIHIEPGEQNFRIRYRIDGVLEDIIGLPMTSFHNLMARIKYLAKLKLDVTHPQDGRFAVKVLKKDIDIRVATMPTSYGEAVVMRLLPKDKEFLSLDKLGFTPEAMAAIQESISKPQGMIINTGPTGSGKTTTLYAILKQLNQPGKKIITLEDPIEYRIEGIEQVQISHEESTRIIDGRRVRSSAQTSFLDALKGAMRQDPDIIMVGEIRDKETAEIALQAAMTGHLVLTTLHTNNAPAAYARLVEMGVEPYLLAGSINLIIAQRLVRLLHRECAGKGCLECHNSGYKGRAAIIEVLKPSAEIEDLVLKKAPLRTFEEAAHKLGMRTMYEDGMAKVTAGLTTKEEIERVTQELN